MCIVHSILYFSISVLAKHCTIMYNVVVMHIILEYSSKQAGRII